MTHQEIESQLDALTREERRVTNQILQLINCAEDRKTYLERGYPSLFAWLTQKFGYSEAAAQRRIQAARLMRQIPEIKEHLQDGRLTLTGVAKAQAAFRLQERTTGESVPVSAKRDLLKRAENQSTLQIERLLVTTFPNLSPAFSGERIGPKDADHFQLTVNLSSNSIDQFERARELLSHILPEATRSEVIAYLIDKFVRETDPIKRPPTSSAAKQSVKTEAIRKAEGRCTYKDPLTGKICGSRYQVQVDHMVPKALGGRDSPENLRVLCRKHNLLMAEKILGKAWASHWKSD